MVSIVDRGRTDELHHLALHVRRGVPDKIVDQVQPVVDVLVVVALGEVVVQAAALAAGEKLPTKKQRSGARKEAGGGEENIADVRLTMFLLGLHFGVG